jgi:hypothetical protein
VQRLDTPSVAPLAPTAATAAVAAAGDARQQAFQRALQTLVGTEVPAKVLARLADGTALVSVAGTNARMLLPAGVNTGSELPLTVVAAWPRPTFQFGQGAGGAPQLLYAVADPRAGAAAPDLYTRGPSGAQARTPLATAPAAALPHGAPADAAVPGAVTTSLSPAARLLGAALAQVAGPPVLRPGAPLLPGPAVAAPALAAALHRTVESSGLFYESHVAEWAAGARSQDSLRAEPQMRHPPGDEAGVTQYVAAQLAGQEHQQVAWQGQLVPGLPLEWRIGRDAPQRDQGGDAQPGEDGADAAWHSGLRLRFPLLGEVQASVSLRGGALDIRLEAGSDEAAALLRAHGPRLAEALQAAGTPLTGFSAARGDKHE